MRRGQPEPPRPGAESADESGAENHLNREEDGRDSIHPAQFASERCRSKEKSLKAPGLFASCVPARGVGKGGQLLEGPHAPAQHRRKPAIARIARRIGGVWERREDSRWPMANSQGWELGFLFGKGDGDSQSVGVVRGREKSPLVRVSRARPSRREGPTWVGAGTGGRYTVGTPSVHRRYTVGTPSVYRRGTLAIQSVRDTHGALEETGRKSDGNGGKQERAARNGQLSRQARVTTRSPERPR